MSHVFISYSRKDKKVVDTFVERLRRQDFIIWQDVSDIPAGEKWGEALIHAIDESAAVLVFCSHSASKSTYVNAEVDHAIAQGKPIIPIWLEDATVLGDKKLNAFNAVKSTSGFSERALKAITKALKEQAPRIQRMASKFNPSQSIGSQRVTGKKRRIFGNKEYVMIPLITSVYSNAWVIAEADVVVRDIKHIQILIQNTGLADGSMVRDAFGAILRDYDGLAIPKEERVVGVYVTGVLDTDSNKYIVDPDNIAHYTDMLDTILKAMHVVSQDAAQTQTFQLFLWTLVDIAFLLGVEINRWWPLQVYKKHGNTYVRIMNVPPRQP